jgi:DNA gyrase subunit B
MPQLVEAGHLYIAQPPLYKVSRGRSEVYLKDEMARDRYLVDTGLEDAVLDAGGVQYAGADLRRLVTEATHVERLLKALPQRYDLALVEQAAIAGALNAELLSDEAARGTVAEAIARRLDLLEEVIEAPWHGRPAEDGGFFLERELRGVREVYVIDAALIESAEARSLNRHMAGMAEVYRQAGMLRRGSDATRIVSPTGLLATVTAHGQKGLSMQRYKGLGEMNPGQLWETTLDPDSRNLLRVKISNADTADEIFSRLMGDVVEPRREFIQDNALKVANLDI